MAVQVCPECGCSVREGFEKEGVVYCCEPCATGGECECGCCQEQSTEETEKK